MEELTKALNNFLTQKGNDRQVGENVIVKLKPEEVQAVLISSQIWIDRGNNDNN